MYGALIGDIVGSKYEFHNIKTKVFPLFSEGCDYTDDTIMTVAVAKAILLSRQEQYEKSEKGRGFREFLIEIMQDFGRRYPCPTGAYGGMLPNGSVRINRSLTVALEMDLQCGFPLAGWRRLPWKRLWHWHVPVPT